ncbi:cytochrome P450 [Lojkania enalia]|uniref:Cytochrome P450 n=1 Tax=Lojkania enalia TaxID=147567 RepID=A0A9P4JZZ0_9PLEO|nr:cytochrome P450 [Didymosphaeria enalia]
MALDANFVLGVCGMLVTFAAYALSQRREKLVGIPVMTGYGEDHERAMVEGTLKYPTTPFVVETQRPFVIVPACAFEELGRIPQAKATLWGVQKQEMCGDYTGLFQHNIELNQALRLHLHRNLANTVDEVENKIDWVFNKELGSPRDWKAFRVHEVTVRIVARLVAGVFVGARFARDDEWTRLSLGLATDLVYARDAIKKWPTWFQPVVGPFLKDIRTVNGQLTKMAEMLKPVIENSVLEGAHSINKTVYDEQKIDLEHGGGEPEGTFMSWVLSRLNNTDPEVIARVQLSLSFASINTTTNALVFMVIDLAARPEYTQPLREEIEEVIREDNVQEDENGVLRLKQASLNKLWKLDSFMKESSRLSKNGITNLRLVQQPIILSTGHRIPKGTRIAFDTRSVHLSPRTQTFSPEYNPPENKQPTEFDGFRFYRLRKMAGKEKLHRFATASTESLTWGYGDHACPGRFFADCELKVLLVELLRKWDIRVKDPTTTNSETLRKMRELVVVVPRDAEVELRRRKF